MAGQNPSSEFHVVLDGLQLGAAVQQHIEGEIRKIVMQELAQIDHGSDYTIVAKDRFPKTREFSVGTTGFRAVFAPKA